MNYSELLSQTVQGIPESGIRKYFDMLNGMKDAIALSIGEPDFDTPWHISDAAIKYVQDGGTHYSSNWGTISLREEIAMYLKGRYDLSYDPKNEILATVGASEGIDLALRALVEPGDEVIIPDPSYVSYMPSVKLCHGVPIPVRTRQEDDFKLTASALKAAITSKTKALIFPYPNNPTGAIMERDKLAEIADVLRGTNIIVISDEIYSELTYGGDMHVSIASLDGMRERTIVLNGFSKAFAMTGWRMGYAAGPREMLYQMVKIHQYTMLCAPVMGQAAAEEALKNGREDGYEDIKKMRRTYDVRRKLLMAGFKDMDIPCFEPKGAFYIFPNISSTKLSSVEFCDRLLDEKHVACIPGTAFGESGEGFIRVSYAASTENVERAIERIGDFVKKYRT